MRCSNCGKDIPFTGNVCPWCHKNKGGDQTFTAMTVLGLCVGAGISFFVLSLPLAYEFLATVGIAIPFVIVGAKAKAKIDAEKR